MRTIKALFVVALLALVSSACKGGGNGPIGPDPIPTIHTLDNIVFQRVIVRRTPPAGSQPIVTLTPLDNSWDTARECIMTELPDGRWSCPQGFDNLLAGEYRLAVMDPAAEEFNNPEVSWIVGEVIWVRTTVHLDKVFDGNRGARFAYVRINPDGTIETR